MVVGTLVGLYVVCKYLLKGLPCTNLCSLQESLPQPCHCSTKIPEIGNMLNVVEDLVYFISAIPRRLECYLFCTEDGQPRKSCTTRWSQYDACLESVISRYGEVLRVIDLIQQVRDPKASSTDASLSRSLESFSFLVCCVICQKLLQYRTPRSSAL